MVLILILLWFYLNFVYFFIFLDYIISLNINCVFFSYIFIFSLFIFNSLYKIEVFINICINNDVIIFGEMCLLFVLGCEFYDVSFGFG